MNVEWAAQNTELKSQRANSQRGRTGSSILQIVYIRYRLVRGAHPKFYFSMRDHYAKNENMTCHFLIRIK